MSSKPVKAVPKPAAPATPVAAPVPAPSEAASDRLESPVELVLSKRLRAVRKKLKHLAEAEAKQQTGEEQACALRLDACRRTALTAPQISSLATKEPLLAAERELVRLSELLAPAVAEERAAASETAAAATRAELLARPVTPQLSPEAAEAVAQQRVGELVRLFYFARLLDTTGSHSDGQSPPALERIAALQWDAHLVWQQPTMSGLSERELDELVALSHQLTSRPPGAEGVVSHNAALARCSQLACAYAAGDELPGSAAAVRGVVAQLSASGFTAQVPTLLPARTDG